MNSSVRSLTKVEHRALKSALAFRRRQLKLAGQRVLIFSVIVFALLCTLTLLTSDVKWQIVVSGGVVLGVVLPAWSYLSVKRDLLPIVGRLESAARRNEARVIRVQSTEVVEFEEEEDEGAAYAFQLKDDQIVVIAGQDYYSSAKFPNTDFSLVDILTEDGSVAEGVIAKQGTKLKPSRVIPVRIWRTLRAPDHLEMIAGRLDQLEQLLTK